MRLTIEVIKEKIEEKKLFKRSRKSIEVKILAGLLYYLEYR
jgi:mRNA degradation ribonuclease J1/J2